MKSPVTNSQQILTDAGSEEILSSAQLDSAKTASLTLAGLWPEVLVEVDYTYGAGTSLSVAPKLTAGDGTTMPVQSGASPSSGVIEMSDLVFRRTGTASFTACFWVKTKGAHKADFTVTAAGSPTTSDTITLRITGCAGD